MKVYIGTQGPIDTKDARLIITPEDVVEIDQGRAITREVERAAVSYKGRPAVIYPRIYKDAKGSVAEMAGDMDTADAYALSVAALRRLDWEAVETQRKPAADVTALMRAHQREAERERAATRARYDQKHKGEGVQYEPSRPAPTYGPERALLFRILPNIRAAGYYVENMYEDWPNPHFRVREIATGDWPDEGPLAANKGVFTLFQLADFFKDPCADDPARRYVDRKTGEVIGA